MLAAAIAAIVVAGAIIVALSLRNPDDGSVRLVGFPKEETGTASFSGAFPAGEDARLANPLGIDAFGGRIYVAESDAQQVRVFRENGARVAAIRIPPASGVPTAYPADIAVIDDGRVAVVDTAGSRVVVMSTDPKADSRILSTLGSADPRTAPRKPTAVEVSGDDVIVADGADGRLKVYGLDGKYARTLPVKMRPRLTFAGGMLFVDGTLFVTDPNAGRLAVISYPKGTLERFFPHRMLLPRGLASAGSEWFFVTDTFGRAVRILGRDGDAIGAIDPNVAAAPSGGEILSRPMDCAWVADVSRLYVTDAGTGQVQVFNVRLE